MLIPITTIVVSRESRCYPSDVSAPQWLVFVWYGRPGGSIPLGSGLLGTFLCFVRSEVGATPSGGWILTVCAQVRIIHFMCTCAQNDVLLVQGWPTDPVAAGQQACCFSFVVGDSVNHASVHFFGACLRVGVTDGGPGGGGKCAGAHALGLLRLEGDGAGVVGAAGIAPTAAHGRPVGPTGCTCRRWWSRC